MIKKLYIILIAILVCVCSTGCIGEDFLQNSTSTSEYQSSTYSEIVNSLEDVISSEDGSIDEAALFSDKSRRLQVSYVRKVDGDTAVFQLESGEEVKVRYLAIDTPESVKPGTEVQEYAIEASDYNDSLLSNAACIELEYDKNADKTDKYNRALCWVFADDELVQQKLVEMGYAKVAYLYGDYKYTALLQECEKFAQQNNFGIWSK